MTDRFEHIDPEVVARLFDGNLTETDRQQLHKAAADNPELAEEVRDIERLGDVFPKASSPESNRPSASDIAAAWQRVADRAGIQSFAPTGPKDGRSVVDRNRSARSPVRGASDAFRLHRLPRGWIAAASVILVVFFGQLLLRPDATTGKRTVATARGQTASLSLSDGTEVVVNSDSRLEYAVHSDLEIRRIVLQGEARFIVNPDGRPFVVETPHATVRVLGTRFTVRSRGGTTRVAVQEGRVSVSSDSLRTELSDLQAIDVSRGALFTRLGSDVAETADDWTEGMISFTRTPLSDVVQDIERRFDIVVRLEGRWGGSETLTGSFPGLDAPVILESVCRTFDCDVRRDGDRFILAK